MSDIYRELVIDHYKNPRNVGEIQNAAVHGEEHNVVCGDTIEYFLKFDGEGKVLEVKWKGNGCALSQAAASLFSEQLKGKTRTELGELTEKDILRLVGTELNPSRQKCATLPLVSLKKGLTH